MVKLSFFVYQTYPKLITYGASITVFMEFKKAGRVLVSKPINVGGSPFKRDLDSITYSTKTTKYNCKLDIIH